MDEEHFEQSKLNERIESIEHSVPILFENTLEDEDSIFEESIMNSTLSPRGESDDADIYGFSEEENDVVGYNPGDLVDLRGLFDEDAVDPLKTGTTLDFEEIPDDIDIDEPIEVEQLSRFGRIMNVIVLVTTILFCLIVVGFIINAAFVIGAVSSANIQTRSYVNITDLDKTDANIDLTILTEVTNFGRFIKGKLSPGEVVSAVVYLIDADGDSTNLNLKDAILAVDYKPTKDIEFDFGKRRLIEMKGIKMKFNPHFDASRLSGLMEARNGDTFHKRYPSKAIISLSAILDVKSFFAPVPVPIKFPIVIPFTEIDKLAEEIKLAKLKRFDFNPKFVEIMEPTSADSLLVNVRQPVPKFYGPPAFEIAIHVPEMNLIVKQFEMTGIYGPYADPDIKKLFKDDSKILTSAKIKPFVMKMSDLDTTPNILNIEAKFEKNEVMGLINILSAIRDNNLKSMGFLFAPTSFSPEVGPLPVDGKSDDNFEAVSFLDFMKTFWGRQLYPASDGTGPALPSVPELYNPQSGSAAFNIKFNGVSVQNDKLNLAFTIRANTHYVISNYNLPLLMLTGSLPKIGFGFHVMENGELNHVAILSFEHHKKTDKNEMVFDLQIEILNLNLLSRFAVKALRLYKIASKGLDPKANCVPLLNPIQGAILIALSKSSLPSRFASVFDLEFNFKDDNFNFLYKNSQQPVLKDFPPPLPETIAVGESAPDHVKITPESKPYNRNDELKVIDQLLDLLGIKESTNDTEVAILDEVEELKKKVVLADEICNRNSSKFDEFNMADVGKEEWKDKLGTKVGHLEPINPNPLIDWSKSLPLSDHQKLAKARELLSIWQQLKRIKPFTKKAQINGVYVHLDSDKKLDINLAVAYEKSEKVFDDFITIEWDDFDVNFASNPYSGHLASVNIFEGSIHYSLLEGNLFASIGNYLKAKIVIGPKNTLETVDSAEGTVKAWMRTLDTFYSQFFGDVNIFIPFYLGFNSAPAAAFQGIIPGPGIIPLKLVTPVKPPKDSPDFFNNLSKSYFDFIGYGFYRLIFNAMLPNPDKCPSGSVIYNVELELPSTAGFLFTKVGEFAPQCVAAINTAQPLRLWTQIVDGVLCNMYSVADGLNEQKMKIQGRVPDGKSQRLIASFKSVIDLHKHSNISYTETSAAANREHPLEKSSVNSSSRKFYIPDDKRFTLSTVVPFTIEFLNFGQFMKVMDEFSAKKHIQIFVGDPSTSNVKSENIPDILLNNLIGHFASKYPSHINSPEQLSAAAQKVTRVISVRDKLVFTVTAASSSPERLYLTAKISIPRPGDEAERSEQSTNTSYIPFDTSDDHVVASHFLHPIIRWGRTKIRFTFTKFIVELSISAGDIKITENNDKILFDSLRNFEFGLEVKARSNAEVSAEKKQSAFRHIKQLFRTTSIRQIFKRCLDNYNEKTNYLTEYPDRIVHTTSSVSYGESAGSQFHFFGAADMESLFTLHGVIARKITPRDGSAVIDKDSPTFMNFGVLVKFDKNVASSANDGVFGAVSDDKSSRLPVCSLPCFFTNFCSPEQLTYSKLNGRGFISNGDHIPVSLHVRDTFQPLAASIASGFSTFLTLFHMDYYPEFLEWHLIVPDEQVVSMEMNGQGMFVGKADSFEISKTAEIPYQNVRVISTAHSSSSESVPLDSFEILSPPPGSNQSKRISYSDINSFEKNDFFNQELVSEFKDEVIVKLKAQVPDCLPGLLRKMLWPMFVPPLDTFSLHPPFLQVNGQGKIDVDDLSQLGHAPMALALSDSMDYIELTAGQAKITHRPSLLTKLFTAFIAENSSPGIDAHKIESAGKESSCSRFHYAFNLDSMNSQNMKTVYRNLLAPHSSEEAVHVIIWSQFPWAMNTIGFDFGDAVEGKIYLPFNMGVERNPFLVEGAMTRHHMIGNVARIRVDLHIPINRFRQILQLAQPIASSYFENTLGKYWTSYVHSVAGNLVSIRELEDIPLGIDFNIGNSFEFKTELTIPKSLFKASEVPTTSRTEVSLTRLRSGSSMNQIIERYRKQAPQAFACVFMTSDDLTLEAKKQGYLWDNLDLGQTRVYYADDLNGINPDDRIEIFFQLRSSYQIPVCGLRKDVLGLAVAIEYIRPKRPFELLFNNQSYFSDPPIQYLEAVFDPVSSVFAIDVSLPHTGRYKVYTSLIIKNQYKSLSKLKYKEVKFTEIYVKNTR